MININFLANKVDQKGKQKQRDAKVFRFSTYFLIVVTLLMIGAFSFKLFNTLRINNTEKKIAEYKNSILSQEKIEINYLIFVNKLKVISEIYQKRSNKQQAMNYFSDAINNTAEITGMNYQEDQGGLTLQLSSDNIFKLKEANNILNSQELRDQYQNIEKSSLTRTNFGNYKLTLKIELKTND